MSSIPTRVGDFLTTYTKTVILVVLVMTVAIGAGMSQVEQQSDTEQFESDSPAADAQAYIEENLTIDDGNNEALVQVIQRGENVLTKESVLESLSLQAEMQERETIRRTFTDERPVFGYANVIGTAAVRAGQPEGEASEQPPTLAEQRAAVEELDQEQLEAIVTDVFGQDGNPLALSFMPASYEPGSTTAQAGSTIVRQSLDTEVQDPNSFPEDLTQAQLEIREITQERSTQYSIFGFGILNDEISQSLGDSGALVGPLALLFVVVALTVAYRDVLDIILGVVGIIGVLVWTFGFMGWANISFNQLLLSVPVLLIGLSIDYAIHVFMRYREQRGAGEDDIGIRRSMSLALAGVGAALVWVTVTAAIGFLANLTSPIGPLQDFGIVSSVGVVAALVIFGALMPAVKIELDGFLEARGIDRQKRAFGTGGSTFGRLLTGGVAAARRFPVAVVVFAILLSLAGGYGATQVDTSFDETDFLADSPPEWTESLPGPMAPGTYQINEDLEFIGENYQQEDNEAEVLIRGDVTNEQTLRWLAQASEQVGGLETLFVGPNGPDISSPLSVMERTAARGAEAAAIPAGERTDQENALAEFAGAYDQATGEDGVPEGNVEELYDLLLTANPDASEFIHNENGQYRAIRLQFGVTGNARIGDIADDNRDVSETIVTASGGSLTATPAGDQVIFDKVQQDLLDTVIQGLLITLVAVFLFLSIAYKLTGNPASLGFVTLVPVALAVTWILGSMWLLEIPFNTLTGTITSLTVGLGIAYSIHISSRYELELRRRGDVWEAMETTVTGTGGALLGSAATTVGGFGTLAIAILPILQQFGIITGLTIIYAFLASVFVLPSLLVLWTRYLGPSGYFPEDESSEETVPGGDEQPAADAEQDAS
ncbi:efflux RND transporter permease subunit [Halovenus salina]|uniref:RND family transporter n=1 Tax=Halovenus salina TaxID=1510225 RepID=A0ABD5VXK1_9EURY|nr:MMPL family transporter [Halovenus salina]